MGTQLHEALAKRRTGSFRKLAQDLGFPSAFAGTLSDIWNGREKHVSEATCNRVRVALGLAPIVTKRVPVCPLCGEVHQDTTFHCRPSAIRARILRKNITVAVLMQERLASARTSEGMSWDDFFDFLLDCREHLYAEEGIPMK